MVGEERIRGAAERGDGLAELGEGLGDELDDVEVRVAGGLEAGLDGGGVLGVGDAERIEASVAQLEFNTGDVRNEELRVRDSVISGSILAADTGKPFDRKQAGVGMSQAQARLVEVEDGQGPSRSLPRSQLRPRRSSPAPRRGRGTAKRRE